MRARRTAFAGCVAAAVFASIIATGGEIPAGERRSGSDFMSRESRAMQDDEAANPGMLEVLDGEALWRPLRAMPVNPAPTATAMRAPA